MSQNDPTGPEAQGAGNSGSENPYAPPTGGEAAGRAAGTPAGPQFGQRSSSWTPASQGRPASQAEGAGQSPWPVYGQGSPSPQPGNAGPGQPWPSYQQPAPGNQGDTPAQPSYGQTGAAGDNQPSFGQGQYGQPSFGQQGQPGQPQYGQQAPWQSSPTPFAPSGTPSGPPPSRTGAVLTLIGGVVAMVIIAPVIFITVLLSGVGLDRMVDGSIQTTNGGVVVVDDSGVLAVSPLTGSADACVLTNESGGQFELYYELESGGTHVGRSVPAGEYTINCTGVPEGAQLLVMDGTFLASVMRTSVSALLWASLVGVIGLGLTIWGIVWLVKRNKQRKQYFAGQS